MRLPLTAACATALLVATCLMASWTRRHIRPLRGSTACGASSEWCVDGWELRNVCRRPEFHVPGPAVRECNRGRQHTEGGDNEHHPERLMERVGGRQPARLRGG